VCLECRTDQKNATALRSRPSAAARQVAKAFLLTLAKSLKLGDEDTVHRARRLPLTAASGYRLLTPVANDHVSPPGLAYDQYYGLFSAVSILLQKSSCLQL